jgi:hypothetical protein
MHFSGLRPCIRTLVRRIRRTLVQAGIGKDSTNFCETKPRSHSLSIRGKLGGVPLTTIASIRPRHRASEGRREVVGRSALRGYDRGPTS